MLARLLARFARRQRTVATAETLRPFIGDWVAVKDGEVIYSAYSMGEVIAHLRSNRLTADSLFRVP